MKSKISVVIPTFNRINIFKKIIVSYIEQPEVKEVIVVDDCSTDETANYFKKKYPKVRYFRNSKNSGAPFCRNRGIDESKGEFIFIGEDDLELTPNYFQNLVKHMAENGADIISGRRVWLQKGETNEMALKRANKTEGGPVDLKLLTTNCEVVTNADREVPLVDASMLIAKRVVEKVRYDEHYRRNAWREETDFQLNALKRGFKTVYCPHTVAFHWYKEKNNGGNHSQSIWRYEWEIAKNNYYMAKKYWPILQKKFGIDNWFFVRFTWYRAKRYLVPYLVGIKRSLIG